MKKIIGLFLFLTILTLTGCQIVFTTPVISVIVDPAALPPEQIADYANNILVTGTDAQIAAAFTAVQDALVANPTDPELNYLAGTMAMAVGGLDVQNILDSFSSGTPIDFASADFQQVLVDSAGFFAAASENGAELSSTDNLVTGVGLFIDAGVTIDNIENLDLNSLTPEQENAWSYIEAGGDTLAQFADQFGITLPV